MIDDAQLLRRYAQERSEEAFAELVRRHVGWVYRTSLRRTGGRSDLAQEVAQNVFTVLARKAESLCQREVLAGWLYTTARYAAGQLMRSEGRRRVHETEAAEMSLREQEGSRGEVRDDALHHAMVKELDRLPEREREAILLRFFQGKSYADVGARLHVGEDAARKRVERGLERLGARLVRGGATSSAGALAILLTSEAAAAAPSGLQAAVTHAALTGAAHGVSTAGVIQLMSATKSVWTGAALLGLAGIIGLGTASVAVYEVIQDRAERASLAEATARYQSEEQAYRTAQRDAAAAQQADTASKAKAVADAKKRAEAEAAARVAAEAGRPRESPNKAKAQREGAAFLAAFPQTRAMLMEIGKNQIARNQAMFFRQAGLTAAQIDAYETATSQHWIDTIMVAPNSIHPGESLLPDDQVEAIVGANAMPAYDDAKRAIPAGNFVGSIALAAAESGSPLSSDQVMALEQALLNNSPEYSAGQNFKPNTVNWSAVMAQAQQTMSPAQWQQAQTALQWQKVGAEAMTIAQSQKGGNGK